MLTGKSNGHNCDASVYSCKYNNPCDPLCIEGQTRYGGNWPNKYVACYGQDFAKCSEGRCPYKTYWNQDHLQCENKFG